MGYGDPTKKSDIILVVVETKGSAVAYIGILQLILNMTAAHQAWSKKENKTIYGILNDGIDWWFAILTNENKLYITYHSFLLVRGENLVLNYFNQILLLAVHSSAHTIRVKNENRTIRQ